jgi:hypothetical protein
VRGSLTTFRDAISRRASVLFLLRAWKVSRPVKCVQDFDPAGGKLVEDEVVLESLDGPNAYVAQLGMIGSVRGPRAGSAARENPCVQPITLRGSN